MIDKPLQILRSKIQYIPEIVTDREIGGKSLLFDAYSMHTVQKKVLYNRSPAAPLDVSVADVVLSLRIKSKPSRGYARSRNMAKVAAGPSWYNNTPI